MPSKSGKQHRLMALVANNPKAAKRLGIPQKVGKEYVKADKGKKFASGGMSRPAALERRRQQEYLERNPQYAEREEGLETVYPEEFMTPGGFSKTGTTVISNISKRKAYEKALKTAGKENDPAHKFFEYKYGLRDADTGKLYPNLSGPTAVERAYKTSFTAKPPKKFQPQDPPPAGKTAGQYRDPAAKRAADKAMRERIKEAESKKDKLRATSPASAPYKNPNRSPYEPRPQSDESSYRKGGSVKSSASSRADGIAQRGKTRGKFI